MESISGPDSINLIHWFAYICIFVFLIVVVEVAIIQNYVTLCFEEHRWWWRTWLSSASTGFWLFLIVLNQLVFETPIYSVWSFLTYLVAAGLACSLVGLMAASVAMSVTFRFNLYIYSKIKSD